MKTQTKEQKLSDLEDRISLLERRSSSQSQSFVTVFPPPPKKRPSIYDGSGSVEGKVCDPGLVKLFREFSDKHSIKGSRAVDIILYNFFRDRNRGRDPLLALETEDTPQRYALDLNEEDYHLLCRLLGSKIEEMEDRVLAGKSNRPFDDDVEPGRVLLDKIRGWKESDLDDIK